jgi:hypothetical protein
LKDKKLRVKNLTETCNATKKEIDIVKTLLDEKADDKKKQLKDELLDDDDGLD